MSHTKKRYLTPYQCGEKPSIVFGYFSSGSLKYFFVNILITSTLFYVSTQDESIYYFTFQAQRIVISSLPSSVNHCIKSNTKNIENAKSKNCSEKKNYPFVKADCILLYGLELLYIDRNNKGACTYYVINFCPILDPPPTPA